MADPASDSTPRSAPHPGHNVFDTDTAGVLTLDITGASDAFYNADTVRAMTVALAEWTDAVVAETEARGGRFAAFTGDGLILWFPTPDAELMLMVTRAAGALWAERGVGLVADLRMKAGLAGGFIVSQHHPGGVSINGEAVTAACHALTAAAPGEAVGARLRPPAGAHDVDPETLDAKPRRADVRWRIAI